MQRYSSKHSAYSLCPCSVNISRYSMQMEIEEYFILLFFSNFLSRNNGVCFVGWVLELRFPTDFSMKKNFLFVVRKTIRSSTQWSNNSCAKVSVLMTRKQFTAILSAPKQMLMLYVGKH